MCAGFPSISSNAAMRSASTARLNVPLPGQCVVPPQPQRSGAITRKSGRSASTIAAHWRPDPAVQCSSTTGSPAPAAKYLILDAAGIDGRAADALLLEGHHAAFNDLDAASRPCLMSATMSSICSMPTDRRT